MPEQSPGGGERRVVMTLMSGVLNQHLWLSMAWLPLTIELELSDFSAPFAPHYQAPGAGAPVQMSQQWSISDARVYCDMAQLDASLSSRYASHLRSGNTLPLALRLSLPSI